MKNYILANPLLIEQNQPKGTKKKKPSSEFTPDTQRHGQVPAWKKAMRDAGYEDDVEGTPSPAIPDPTEPETWIPFVADELGKSVDEIGDPSNWTEDQMVQYLRIALGSLKQLDNIAYNLFLGDLATTTADDFDTGLRTALEDLLSNEEEELKADLDAAEEFYARFGDKLNDPKLTPEEQANLDQEMAEFEKIMSKQRRTGKAPSETPGVKGGDETKMIDIERFIDPGFELGDLADYDVLWDAMKKEFPQDTGEPNEAYAIRIFSWALMQLFDGALGLDFTEIGQFVIYMSEGEFEKAWNEIAPNLEAVTDQAVAFAVKAIEEIEVEGKYPATAVRRSKDKELSEAYTTAATTVVSWLVMTKLLPIIAMIYAKRRALQNLVTLGRVAKLTPEELLKLAKDRLDGPIGNWIKGDSAFEAALDKAARAEGWTGDEWGTKTSTGLERSKKYFTARSEPVARALLGGPLLYDAMASYYDNALQSEMGIEVAKKMLSDLKEATGYSYETIDEAKEGLQKIIDRYTKRKGVLDKLTREGSIYNNQSLLKLKAGQRLIEKLTGIYNSAPAGTSLSTNAEKVDKAISALRKNKNDQAARKILSKFISDYNTITDNALGVGMRDAIVNYGWPTANRIKGYIDEAKELEEEVKRFKAASDNLKKQINTFWGSAIRVAKNKTISMMRGALPLYEDSFAGAVINMEEFADIAKTDSGLNKLFRDFEDKVRVGRGSLDLLKIFVKKAADVTELVYSAAAKISAGTKKVKDILNKPVGNDTKLIKFLKRFLLENKKDTSKTKYYLLTEESKRQSNENFEAALKKLIDEAGKEIDSKANQKENEIDSQIATAEADVTASMDGLYDMIRATARTALSDDIETIFGAAMSLPADETPANESKIRITKSKLVDLISEQVKEQTETVDVTKDQLVALVAQEAFKQINRKK